MKSIIYKILLLALAFISANMLRAQPAKTVNGIGTKEKEEPKEEKTLLSKEVTIETTCVPNATVFVENVYRNIIIKTSNDSKVKLVTTVYFETETKDTDAEWFEKTNIELKGTANQVVVKSNINNASSNNIASTSLFSSSISPAYARLASSTDRLNSLSGLQFRGKKATQKQDLTIYVPAGARLDVESKYADVNVLNPVKDIKIKINNASLVMEDADHASIVSRYGNINAGNIKNAEIEITNGRMTTKNIEKLDIDSKYSSVEFGTSNNVKIRSVNDQYEIDEVADMVGRKDYGNLRITSLKNSIDLIGSNADIKIRSIEATASLIKLDNKYADLRLPVYNLKNYNVDFDGQYSSVYAPFEIVEIPKEVTSTETDKKTKTSTSQSNIKQIKIDGKTYVTDTAVTLLDGNKLSTTSDRYTKGKTYSVTGYGTLGDANILYGSGGNFGDGKNSRFKTDVGDMKGKHTVFQLTCINCTLDFK